MQIWILTFERPKALNRLILNIGNQGGVCSVWSNSPKITIDPVNEKFVKEIIINPVNTSESTSYCARSWNSIYLKAFAKDDELAAFQDDTDVTSNFMNWINEEKQKYDFIWGTAGDQFHFLKKKVLQKVGWWDERFNGCFCGDADFLKRVTHEYDLNKISVEEYHGWGYHHNSCNIRSGIIPCDFGRSNQIVDSDYVNQYYAYTNIDKNNRTINASRQHYVDKWNEELLPDVSVRNKYDRRLREIDWYPWASRKFNFEVYKD